MWLVTWSKTTLPSWSSCSGEGETGEGGADSDFPISLIIERWNLRPYEWKKRLVLFSLTNQYDNIDTYSCCLFQVSQKVRQLYRWQWREGEGGVGHKAVPPGPGEEVSLPVSGVIQGSGKILGGREDCPLYSPLALDQIVDGQDLRSERALWASSCVNHSAIFWGCATVGPSALRHDALMTKLYWPINSVSFKYAKQWST